MKKNHLVIEITATQHLALSFECEISGSILNDKYRFQVFLPFLLAALNVGGITLQEAPELEPIIQTIQGYELTKNKWQKLIDYFYQTGPDGKYLFNIEYQRPHISTEACSYFGEILKEILTEYDVDIKIQEYYFPSPTSMAVVTPIFSLGLQKSIKPINPIATIDEYETTLVYLSHSQPQSTAQIQLKLLDALPEERLHEIQRSFKDSLSPYGLKCLYLTIEECGKNKRSPWFNLDTNRCLDFMGYKRLKKGSHHATNKKRFLEEVQALTRINFNIEKRAPKKRSKKDRAMKFQAPLLSITGKFEEYEVDAGRPIEEGILIKDGIQIFIHPEIYKYIDSWYTFIPHDFLKIDIGRTPHAVSLYSYVANQWRIGWHEYHGTIRQPMRQILDGAGLLSRLPKRKNQQRDFVERVKKDIRWLKTQENFWIKRVYFETTKNKPILDRMATIEMGDNHPLKTSMTKQIPEG